MIGSRAELRDLEAPSGAGTSRPVAPSGAHAAVTHRPRSFSIAQKLAAAMALPLVTAVIVLGLEIADVERESAAVRRQTALAVSADGPSRLLISLQNEQAFATVEVIGLDGQADLLVQGYEETRRSTDQALAGFELVLDNSPEETRRAFGPASEGLAAELAAIREQIDATAQPRTMTNLPLSQDVFDGYNELTRPFLAGIEQLGSAVERPELRQGVEIIDLTGRQVLTLGDLGREVGFTSFFSGGVDPRAQRENLISMTGLQARFVRLAEAIRSRSTGIYAGAGDDDLFVGFTDAIVGQIEAALDGTFNPAEFFETITPPQDETYQSYRERVATILVDRADDLRAAAARRERIYVVGILVTGALAIVTVTFVARSLTRPLRSLTDQVMHAAHHGLRRAVDVVLGAPTSTDLQVPRLRQISVPSGDEVGEVATVMNTVQDTVVDLAVEQAVLRRNLADAFVSLGRRNQNLLRRQMDFITELQRNEVDSAVLAQLFQLDHLATRMRRNAESLLVLAGDETPRKWGAPVGVLDIVRAALSEVEQYQRVALAVVEPFTIRGHAVADVAHLLAELLENALMFSPPLQTVEVRGLAQPAGYTIAIVDGGVGMPTGEIAQANRRLAGAEAYTVAPSRYLGHYVAGNLAARHGIRVELQRSHDQGITAVVHLPVSICA